MSAYPSYTIYLEDWLIMAMSHIQKDNKHSSSILPSDIMKVVVIGEPQVGKTSFIRAFYDNHKSCQRYSHIGFWVYPCEFVANDKRMRAEIFEIPGDLDFFIEQRSPHYEDANVIVLMYAIDHPLSLELLRDRWFPEVCEMIKSKEIPVVLVGNKKDLRDDPQVIERLALDGEKPVTYEQGEDLVVNERIIYFSEISTNNLEEVNKEFDLIFKFALPVDIMKVVVIGEPQVGKTSFIRAYYDHHKPCQRYSHIGFWVYPCEFVANDIRRRAEIFEIPGDLDFFIEQRSPHYEDANVNVLMYAIDHPLSLELLRDRWFPEVCEMMKSKEIPAVLVGNKKDLRDDPQVIERLALGGEKPVTYEQGEDLLVNERIIYFSEISTNNLEEVNKEFDLIFNFALF